MGVLGGIRVFPLDLQPTFKPMEDPAEAQVLVLPSEEAAMGALRHQELEGLLLVENLDGWVAPRLVVAGAGDRQWGVLELV
jgi:hypothetical protein